MGEQLRAASSGGGVPSSSLNLGEFGQFSKKLFRVRASFSSVASEIELQTPFLYYQMYNLLLSVNLSLTCYVTGVCTESLFAPILNFLALVVFLGIRELNVALSDPFGGDEVDFPMRLWLECMIMQDVALLEADDIDHYLREETRVDQYPLGQHGLPLIPDLSSSARGEENSPLIVLYTMGGVYPHVI